MQCDPSIKAGMLPSPPPPPLTAASPNTCPLCRFETKMAALKVTRPSFFFFWGGGGRVPSYFETLWCPHLYFYRKSNT